LSALLRRLTADDARGARPAVDAQALARAAVIVEDVRTGGADALRRWAEELGDVAPGAPLLRGPAELAQALASLARDERELLERTAARVRGFAEAQRACLAPLDVPVEGGRAGHELRPVERAGCYAPGGRYPLPSSVLMTVVPARVAGVREVWVASPRPAPITLAAAAVAGADGVLAAGGAQAIAAFAYGAGDVPAADFLCGPGNRYVTAAKKLVFGDVGVDMLAGPSELLVVADATADPGLIAADLLAQAEHDPDARPWLALTCSPLLARVEAELRAQLADLPTAETARAALAGGGVFQCEDLDAAAALAARLAPEHLELLVREPRAAAARFEHAGALFLGPASGEVLGDYGAGPNHVLPTGASARARAGLSVFDFLRPTTWLELHAGAGAAGDAARLARLEGLEAHARAAERRAARSCS
jgi:phosphoribosyl-ATP pyrophosphohydrolase/phosphoribosyl-AMP cyclohydrolase/histidinol dehydrogenase